MSPLLGNRHFLLFVATCGASLSVLEADGLLHGWILALLLVNGPLLATLLPADPDPRFEGVVNTLPKVSAFVLVPWLVLRRSGHAASSWGALVLGLAHAPGSALP
jgi:hypothetical protein